MEGKPVEIRPRLSACSSFDARDCRAKVARRLGAPQPQDGVAGLAEQPVAHDLAGPGAAGFAIFQRDY
jgi:hypothetical protein